MHRSNGDASVRGGQTDSAENSTKGDTGNSDKLVLAAGSLGDIQQLNRSSGTAAVTDVQWTTKAELSETPQQAPKQLDKDGVSNNLAETISFKGHGPGADMRALKAFEPKLANSIEKVATDLAKRPAEEQQQILDIMKKMYDGMNPLKTDNRESAEALRKAKLNPDYVDGVRQRAEEVMKLPKDQQTKALQQFQKQFREFYLD